MWWRAVAALVVALALQVGVNYANDYSDGVRGTDAGRVGPLRLVASGLVPPSRVKCAALASFAVAGCAGLALSLAVAPWLIAVGAACVAAAWFYTGGRRPYGYAGLGEAAVFIFFGPVATAGSSFVQLDRVTGMALLASVPVGLVITAMLVVNNIRDLPGDAAAGKATLVVRLGQARARALYAACTLVPFAAVVALAALYRPWAALGLAALPLAAGPTRRVLAGASGPSLVTELVATGRLELALGVLLAAGIAL
jgi:1,4-dihydroxy-2-naphthoate octaprenyltransferase